MFASGNPFNRADRALVNSLDDTIFSWIFNNSFAYMLICQGDGLIDLLYVTDRVVHSRARVYLRLPLLTCAPHMISNGL